MPPSPRPTRADLLAAAGSTIPDVLAPDLRILFCGINPSLYSGWMGHHFARPGNRFWPTLHRAGFTDRLLHPREDGLLAQYGYGLTNLVPRATASADELSSDELQAGGQTLAAKVREFRPQVVAVLGISAYRLAFARPRAILGRQTETLGDALLWVLPNPSGLNAHHSLADLVRLFSEFRQATDFFIRE